MKHFLKQLFANKRINTVLFRFFNWVDVHAYKVLSVLAIEENGGVHPKHAILDYHKFYLDAVDTNDTVLDLGCGNGETVFAVAKKAKQCIGIDLDEGKIEKAKKKYSAPNVSYVAGDATIYEWPQRFDKIILSNVLEHIEHRVDFLKKLSVVGNTILLRVPLINRDWLTVYKKQRGVEYRLDMTHVTEYTLPQLEEELAAAGWKLASHSIQFGELWGVVTRRYDE